MCNKSTGAAAVMNNVPIKFFGLNDSIPAKNVNGAIDVSILKRKRDPICPEQQVSS